MSEPDDKKGIVYILTNRAMPDYIKIGRTGATPEALEQRIKNLDNTGTPLPFECFYAVLVDDPNQIETLLHNSFSDSRVRLNREFFKMDPSHARSALQISGGEDMTPTKDLVDDEDSKQALKRTIASPLTFKMVNIEVGSQLYFWGDETITCVTLNLKNKIKFEDEETSPSAAAAKVLTRQGKSNSSVAGTNYWMFEGETLSARRRRIEGERQRGEEEADD